MPSAKRLQQLWAARRGGSLAVLVLCGALGAGSLAGCETTQEKAAAQRAKSERILEARARRQAQKRHQHGHRHQNQHKHEKGKG